MSAKILLIEDDLFLRQLYCDLLTQEKYSVETAEEGNTGYKKIVEGNWDLVLLDMNLPGMTGLEIMNKIKSETNVMPYKKLIFMTNSDNQVDIENIRIVSDGYLLKSNLNPDEFITRVKEYLS
ncbi:MAG: response regulator [Patescibacteria group bacterium]